MANVNTATFIGRLVRDPEVKKLSSDSLVANLSLATTRKFKDKDGELKEDTCYIDVVAWNRQAEIVEDFLVKGQQIYCSGHLELDQWLSQQVCKNCGHAEEVQRQKHRVVMDKFQFLGVLKKDEEQNSSIKILSANLNRVEFIGRLVRDPELKELPSGSLVANLSLATTRKFKDKNGDLKEDTCYIDIVAWNRQAEIVEDFLAKGQEIWTEGHLELDQWQTQHICKNCGHSEEIQRQKHRMVMDRFQCTGPIKKESKANYS